MNAQGDINSQFFISILNSIVDPVFVKDDNFQFIYVNDALCEMLGIDRKNIIGKTLGESLPADQMAHFLEIDTLVLRSGQANTSEELVTGKDGKILNIITKKSRYTDEKGNDFIVGIIRDDTERRKAEEALKKSSELYMSTVSAINDGVWDWNVQTGNAFFTQAYYNMLGYEDNEFTANYDSWKTLVHADDIERVEKELQQSIASGEGFAIDLRMKMKSGDWLWVSTRGKTIEKDTKGKSLRMVGTLTNITARKQAEDTIANKVSELESMNSLMIGRELRMIELKKEADELRKSTD